MSTNPPRPGQRGRGKPDIANLAGAFGLPARGAPSETAQADPGEEPSRGEGASAPAAVSVSGRVPAAAPAVPREREVEQHDTILPRIGAPEASRHGGDVGHATRSKESDQEHEAARDEVGEDVGVEYVNVTLELPQSLYARVERFHRHSGAPYNELVFTAIEMNQDRLPALVAEEIGDSWRAKLPEAKPLFERTSRARRAKTTGETEATKRTSFRSEKSNRALLDEIAKQCGARNRTVLMTAALRAFMDYVERELGTAETES